MTAAPAELGPTVFVIDDKVEVRDSLKWLIESSGISVETFPSPLPFLEGRHWDRPGCLILDERMDEMGGLDLQQRLKELDACLPIIMISAYANVPMVIQALTSGALHFLEKPFNDADLLDLIQKGLQRNAEIRGERERVRSGRDRIHKLTPRERLVMNHVVLGHQNKEIARRHTVSEKTIEVHRSNMMAKMGVGSVAELVRLVCELEAAGQIERKPVDLDDSSG